MRNWNFWLIFFILHFFMIACSDDNEKVQLKNDVNRLMNALDACQNENQNIKNQNAQIISELEEKNFSNTKLIKDAAEADIRATGITLTTLIIGTVVVLINNLIWIIAYRRKK